MTASRFVQPMHPKTEILPNAESIRRILSKGWAGQIKIHGHRAQIHLSSNLSDEPIAYNRQGNTHKKLLPPEIVKELRRLFQPTKEWNALDAEWLKDENKLFVFDFIKFEGKVLHSLNYAERFRLLPRDFISPYIQVPPMLMTLDKCLEVLSSDKPEVEGLVFKSLNTPGFSDTSIVRCRKADARSPRNI